MPKEWYNVVNMLQEVRPCVVDAKEKRAERLYSSRSARERIIQIYEARRARTPEKADVALVLGTSLGLYPDKFRKRVYTATQLAQKSRVSRVIFSGRGDHETDDKDQALDAKKIAIFEFGLDEEKISTVGGDNTCENMEMARELLAGSGEKINNVFIVSNGSHLIRVMSLADYVFRNGVNVHPFPIPNEGEIDPNDPRVIMETIKAVLYNRLLNKNANPVSDDARRHIDEIAFSYTQQTRAMPRVAKASFEEWKKTIVGKTI